MQADRVLLVEPRGFCAGVESAVKALAALVRLYGRGVHCVHDVVHNRRVVERFERLGVVFVDSVDDVPPGAVVMLSAHGTAPAAARVAAARGRVVVDAACPLVTKVHHEIRTRAAAGDTIVYVGHEGHDEAEGAVGVAADAVHRVEDPAEVSALPEPANGVALLAQTTLALDDWAAVADAVRARWPDAWEPARADVCYATTNRQAALREVAAGCDAVVVVGSATSANTAALAATAARAGCPVVVRVDGADELPDGRYATVGVTAGASAPEDAVREVVAALGPTAVERVRPVTEDVRFPLPAGLRRLLAAHPAGAALLARDRALDADAFLREVEDAVSGRRAAS